jgi:hypothetical protein
MGGAAPAPHDSGSAAAVTAAADHARDAALARLLDERITALERDVAALLAEVAALRALRDGDGDGDGDG